MNIKLSNFLLDDEIDIVKESPHEIKNNHIIIGVDGQSIYPCRDCDGNWFNAEDLPISKELQIELCNWRWESCEIVFFDENKQELLGDDYEPDDYLEEFNDMVNKHHEIGKIIYEKIKNELPDDWTIEYDENSMDDN